METYKREWAGDALAVPCSVCGSLAGDPCTDWSATELPRPHGERAELELALRPRDIRIRA